MPRRPQLAVVPFNYPTDRAYEDLRERDASRSAVWIQRACHRLAPFWQQMNAATHPEVLGSGFWVLGIPPPSFCSYLSHTALEIVLLAIKL